MKDRRDDDAAWADLVARLEQMDPGTQESGTEGPETEESGAKETVAGQRSGSHKPPHEPSAEQRAQNKAADLEDFFASQPFFPTAMDEPSGLESSGPRDWSPGEEVEDEDTEYVPEDPPSVFSGRPDRVLAWIVVACLPLLMLAFVLFKVTLPSFGWYVFIAAELGALLYLGWTLPRHRRDPWDDGARV